MLSQMRNSLTGPVAWFIGILLIAAFALWGVPSLSELTRSSALTVGGESFSAQYVQNEFNRAVDQHPN